MKNRKVSAADRSGVENVEKNNAIAVTSASSTKVRKNARSSSASSAGRSQAATIRGEAPQLIYASTAYNAAAITDTLTTSVSNRPAHFPSPSCGRLIGLARRL